MAKGSENQFPHVTVTEQGSTPANPASGDQKLFIDSADNKLKRVNSSGAVTTIEGGSDAIPWYGLATITAPPAVSGFTWVNQESATATETSSVIRLYNPGETGTHLHLLVKAKTAPYIITALIMPSLDGSYQQGGFCWRNSGDGKVVTYGPNFDAQYGIRVCKWNSVTAVSAYYAQLNTHLAARPLWYQIEDNNTSRICRYSTDGQTWITQHTIGRTDFTTADQAGFYIGEQTTGTVEGAYILASWVEA